MNAMRWVAVLCFLAACGVPAAPPATGAAPAPANAAATEQATFLLQQGENTLMTERVTRTGEMLRGEVTAPMGPRLTYEATLSPDATIPRIEVRLFQPGADTLPTQRVVATVRGDSAIAQVFEADSVRTNRTAVPPQTLLTLNPSIGLVEQIVRRARALGGQTAQVPLLPLNRGSSIATARVSFTGDSAVISAEGTEVRLQVDEAGRILGGSIPAQGLTITRTTTGTP